MPEDKIPSVIIAGTTGLIGHHLLALSLQSENVANVYSLSRKEISLSNTKLKQLLSPTLEIDKKKLIPNAPKIGFIALGTTIKKAGSKQALKAIDVHLVVDVAKSMQQIGVESIYIVSCIGASPTASSHYLKCKGEMEKSIEEIGFKRVGFMQPGPLSGDREEVRKDEKFLQGVMKLFNPLIRGKLLNYKPIEGEIVAKFMLNLATNKKIEPGVQRFTSKDMLNSI